MLTLNLQGCIFFLTFLHELLVGVGKKYDNLLRQNTNIRGEELEKRGKGEKLLKEVRGGAKISYFGQIFIPDLL